MDNCNKEIEASELIRNYIRRGDATSLKQQLLQSNLGVECTDVIDNTPLLQAAWLGKCECLRLLLEIGQANYDVVNVLGQNALTLASYVGCIDCIKVLLTKWTYQNYTESCLLPPLCVAAMKGHLEIVKFFCQLTPPPNLIESAHGVSPFELAERNGHKEVVQYLSEVFPAKLVDQNTKSKRSHLKSRFKPYSK